MHVVPLLREGIRQARESLAAVASFHKQAHDRVAVNTNNTLSATDTVALNGQLESE